MVLYRTFITDTGEPLHICSSLLGDRDCPVDLTGFLRKAIPHRPWWSLSFAHSLLRTELGSQCSSSCKKILKRPFICDTGETLMLYTLLSRYPGRQQFWAILPGHKGFSHTLLEDRACSWYYSLSGKMVLTGPFIGDNRELSSTHSLPLSPGRQSFELFSLGTEIQTILPGHRASSHSPGRKIFWVDMTVLVARWSSTHANNVKCMYTSAPSHTVDSSEFL